jgi:lipopolysaccharide transport system permease protein
MIASSASTSGHQPYRIEPSRSRFRLGLGELWEHRELLYFLVWRDVKIRYQQTFLGVAWAMLQPLVAMFVFTIVFNRLGGIPSEYGVPYPLFVMSGLLPWFFFSTALSKSALSVVNNTQLVTKVYCPRLLIPIGTVLVALVDFVVSFVLLVALFVWYGRFPDWHAILIPFFLGTALFTALGVGFWLSALNVRFRDIEYVVPFLAQTWLFLSPVVYGSTAVPSHLQWLISLNPMTGVIDGFRWAVLGRGIPHYGIFGISWAVALGVALSGLWYFRRVERDFADII